MNTAIIVAAGSGTRFESDTPKQFLPLAGKPVIVHSLKTFQSAASIDEIVVVVAADHVERVQELTVKHSISKVSCVVVGGATRAESVSRGLDAVDSKCEIVAVHDGARPLVTVDEITRTVAKAAETGAACLVASVTDTIKTISGDEISGTLDRDKLRRALTPQAFRREILQRAYEMCDDESAATDECYLVEKLGHPIAFVEGSSQNIKITRPEDLVIAEAMMSHGR